MTTTYRQPVYDQPGQPGREPLGREAPVYRRPESQAPGYQQPEYYFGGLAGHGWRGVAEGPDPIPERLLWQLWKKRAARQEGLRTEAGRRVRVLYPGRQGTAAGPDFRDALLEIEGTGLVRGDVEIHRRQRDWDAHGHNGDPNYNGVVLHGALEVESEATPLASGGQAPVLSLASLFSPELSLEISAGVPLSPDALSSPATPETVAPPDLWALLALKGLQRPENAAEAGALLDWAGDQRFLTKASLFLPFIYGETPSDEPARTTSLRAQPAQAQPAQAQPAQAQPAQAQPAQAQPAQTEPDKAQPDGGMADQALYEALLEGLGYRHNRQPFVKLAYLAPYAALVRAAGRLPMEKRREERPEAIKHWLLAVSGLEPPAAVHGTPPPGLRRTMNGSEWRLFRVRPSNHPARRIQGAAVLVDRFLETGLAAGLEQAALAGGASALVRELRADGDNGAAIGLGRARDLAVNAVLPFLHAYRGHGPGGSPHLEMFRVFPGLPANELTKEMAAELLPGAWQRQATGARRQQGLLHLAALLKGAA